MKSKILTILIIFFGSISISMASSTLIQIFATSLDGNGANLGTITMTDVTDGIDIKLNLHGLPPGEHGFHVHEFANCSAKEKDGKMVLGLAAGGHFDPSKTSKHSGPEGGGHLGDLPKLIIAADGTAQQTLHIKGVKVADFQGRSVIIHANGDNYSDMPAPLGGGGARIAGGLIK